jgi:hypothetical protein
VVPLAEVRPGDVYTRRLRRRGPTWRQVLHVAGDGRVVYKTPRGTRGACTIKTFLRWADRLNRHNPKGGPLC